MPRISSVSSDQRRGGRCDDGGPRVVTVRPRRREPSGEPSLSASRTFWRGPNHRSSETARRLARADTTSGAGQGDRLGCANRSSRSAVSPPSSVLPVLPSFSPTASNETSPRHIPVEPNILGFAAIESGDSAPDARDRRSVLRRASHADTTPRRTDPAVAEGTGSVDVLTTAFRRPTPNSVNGIFTSGGRTPTGCPLQARCRSD